MSQNFTVLMNKFNAKLEFYTKKCAPVSHFSRSKIANTFLLSIFWYIFKILDPPSEMLDQICRKVENYIWSGLKRWVPSPFVYLPQVKYGVRNQAAQIATFRLTFFNKILSLCGDNYFLSESIKLTI